MTSDNLSGSNSKDRESAFIIHPQLANKSRGRDMHAQTEEASGLVRAIHLDVTAVRIVKPSKINAGHFLGKGQREDIGHEIKQLKPDVVVFNHALSPVQQRNLEKDWKAKVIDRTGLILEIFGERAQTKEGRLQVELAALDYQRSRLVRSWTHLERQRGATGFIGGPGETQIEIDRRLIGERITKLKKELEDVRRTRDLGRQSRERVPFPVVALVGYTNAGKSTLFNHLTRAGVFAEDLPFATLDPTMRRIELPNGSPAILSDTVGFIADLPTHLIEAFRATLEQITYADVIVHVIDAARPDFEAQRQDVTDILGDLGIDAESDERIIEVYNKIDTIADEDKQELIRKAKCAENISLISALSGEGMDEFLKKVTHVIARKRVHARFDIRAEDGKALSWLYEHAEILERLDQDNKIVIEAMIEPADLGKFVDYHGYKPHFYEEEGMQVYGA